MSERRPGRLRRARDAVTRTRLLVTVAAVTRFGGGILMGTALAVYIERAGGSPLAVSLLYTAYWGGLMLFAPVWGAVADVTGRRRAVLVGTGALASLAVLPLLLVENVWATVGLRGLYAVFAAGFPPVMLAIASDSGGDAGRGRSLGFYNSVRGLGFTGGQLGAGVLLGLLAPSGLYLFIAGASLVSTLAVAALSPAETLERDRSNAGEVTLGAVLAAVSERLFPAAGHRGHLRTNGLAWLYVALALRNMTVLGIMSLMPVYLTGTLGTPELVMGALLALNPGGQAVCMYLFGRLTDVTGRKSLIALGMAGSGTFAVVASLAAAPPTLWARVAVAAGGFVLIAASFSAMTAGALAFIGDVAPAGRESELMGLRSTAKGLGGVLGPPLFGTLATVTTFQRAFLAGSLLSFLAAGLVVARLVETGAPRASTAGADD